MWSVRWWCQFIRQGRQGLTDDPRSTRPAIDFIDTRILSALERAISLGALTSWGRGCFSFNNYSPPARFIWNKIFHLRWAPHELAPDLRGRGSEICERRLPILETRELDLSRMLVTRDESWFMLEYQDSTKWSLAGDEVPARVNQIIGTIEAIFTMICEIDLFHVVDMIPPEGVSTLSSSLLILWILCGRKSFRMEGKAVHFDWVSTCTIDRFILQMCQTSLLIKILSSLILMHETILSWNRPTSGFSAISRHHLQIVSSMMLMTFLRRSSSCDWDSALWITLHFSPLDRTSEIDLSPQWRLRIRVNGISWIRAIRCLLEGYGHYRWTTLS
jgi:hypothetical protein